MTLAFYSSVIAGRAPSIGQALDKPVAGRLVADPAAGAFPTAGKRCKLLFSRRFEPACGRVTNIAKAVG
jgi:hypothetical protein